MATIAEGIEIALRHQQAGNLDAAEQIYQQILAVDPTQRTALHRLGLIAYQTGRLDLAIHCLTQATALAPSEPDLYSDLGTVQRAQGRYN